MEVQKSAEFSLMDYRDCGDSHSLKCYRYAVIMLKYLLFSTLVLQYHFLHIENKVSQYSYPNNFKTFNKLKFSV